MKIGIYGDSYAAEIEESSSISWISVLKKLLSEEQSFVEVNNYAKAGSSVYFSYTNFINTNHKYDLIIFLVSNPNRYPTVFKPKKINNFEVHFPNIEQVKFVAKECIENLTKQEKDFLQNLHGWFAAGDKEYHREMVDLILEKIENTHNNVIIYPCFSQSFTEKRFKKNSFHPYLHTLDSFYIRQIALFDIKTFELPLKEKNTISCHMTKEFNEFFAKLLYNKIQNDIWDYSGFFDISIEKPKTYYYSNWD